MPDDTLTFPSRRNFLSRVSGAGFGCLALSALAGSIANAASAARIECAQSSSPQAAHLPCQGEAHHLLVHGRRDVEFDTFEYKPEMQDEDGKPGPGGGTITASRFKFKQYGRFRDVGFQNCCPTSRPMRTISAFCAAFIPIPRPTRKPSFNCTPAARTPRSPGPVWGPGCSMDWD